MLHRIRTSELLCVVGIAPFRFRSYALAMHSIQSHRPSITPVLVDTKHSLSSALHFTGMYPRLATGACTQIFTKLRLPVFADPCLYPSKSAPASFPLTTFHSFFIYFVFRASCQCHIHPKYRIISPPSPSHHSWLYTPLATHLLTLDSFSGQTRIQKIHQIMASHLCILRGSRLFTLPCVFCCVAYPYLLSRSWPVIDSSPIVVQTHVKFWRKNEPDICYPHFLHSVPKRFLKICWTGELLYSTGTGNTSISQYFDCFFYPSWWSTTWRVMRSYHVERGGLR